MTTSDKPKLRFSLKSLLVAITVASVLCLLLIVVAPQVWAFVGEMLAIRAVRRFAFAMLGLVAVFVGIIVLGTLFRFATIFAGSVLESAPSDHPHKDSEDCE